jgi:hypothetical protein
MRYEEQDIRLVADTVKQIWADAKSYCAQTVLQQVTIERLYDEVDKRLAQIEAHQATVIRQQDEIERLTRLLAAALAVAPKSYSEPIMEVLRNKAEKESGQWKESE